VHIGRWLRDSHVADGALGTELRREGLAQGEPVESWVLSRPFSIEALQRAYVEAGAEVLLTATFAGNAAALAAADLAPEAERIHRAAVGIARRASSGRALVAGDMGPIGRDMPHLEAESLFEWQARWLLDAGVDLLWIETMGTIEEFQAAVRGARKAGEGAIIATFSLHRGVDPGDAGRAALREGVEATGINCGMDLGSNLVALSEMARAVGELPLVAKPGVAPGRDLSPASFSTWADGAFSLGVRVVGGCCGTRPTHIRGVASRLMGAASLE
jgi:5-methyltetrahydrofolate--homocysteine methyltransferase